MHGIGTQRYAVERLLFRISQSADHDNFVLKGFSFCLSDQVAVLKSGPGQLIDSCHVMRKEMAAEGYRRPLVEENLHATRRLRAANSRTASACSRATPGNCPREVPADSRGGFWTGWAPTWGSRPPSYTHFLLVSRRRGVVKTEATSPQRRRPAVIDLRSVGGHRLGRLYAMSKRRPKIRLRRGWEDPLPPRHHPLWPSRHRSVETTQTLYDSLRRPRRRRVVSAAARSLRSSQPLGVARSGGDVRVGSRPRLVKCRPCGLNFQDILSDAAGRCSVRGASRFAVDVQDRGWRKRQK